MRTAIAVLLALTGLAAGAQEGTLKKIKDSGAITLGHRDASVPFSYYDQDEKPVGYSLDLCHRIVAALKAGLEMSEIDVRYQPVSAANRIALMANATIDLECGSTTNTLERQERVSYTLTHFVAANRFVARASGGPKSFDDLKGKAVVSTAGTTSIEQLRRINAEKKLGAQVIPANGHAEAFLMVATGRAAAFVMDDVLLRGLVATSDSPLAFAISQEALSIEPYAIMLRKDDPGFKKAVDGAMRAIYRSGEIEAIYAKWFLSPIPPKGVNLDLPMSRRLKKVIDAPTDSGNPADYR